MKRFFYLLILISISKLTFGKGCSGVYYIKGTAFGVDKVVLKNSELTIVFGNEVRIVTTDDKGQYEIEVKWINSCPSRVTKKQRAEQNAKLNPKIIYVKYKEFNIEIKNDWFKYAECFPENKEKVTKKKNLSFE